MHASKAERVAFHLIQLKAEPWARTPPLPSPSRKAKTNWHLATFQLYISVATSKQLQKKEHRSPFSSFLCSAVIRLSTMKIVDVLVWNHSLTAGSQGGLKQVDLLSLCQYATMRRLTGNVRQISKYWRAILALRFWRIGNLMDDYYGWQPAAPAKYRYLTFSALKTIRSMAANVKASYSGVVRPAEPVWVSGTTAEAASVILNWVLISWISTSQRVGHQTKDSHSQCHREKL